MTTSVRWVAIPTCRYCRQFARPITRANDSRTRAPGEIAATRPITATRPAFRTTPQPATLNPKHQPRTIPEHQNTALYSKPNARLALLQLAIRHISSMPDRAQEDTSGRRRESQGNLAGPVELRRKGLEPARKTHSDRDASHIAKHRCQPGRCQIHRAKLRMEGVSELQKGNHAEFPLSPSPPQPPLCKHSASKSGDR